MGIALDRQLCAMIAQYTIEGRQAVRLLADAYSAALFRHYEQNGDTANLEITKADLLSVIQAARLTPTNYTKASPQPEIGQVFGLGVAGFLGSVIEIEAAAFPAAQKGKGVVRFNDTAGSMAKDSVFNAASVFRMLTGEELSDYDIHVNVVGGGNIDGPSAGAAVLLAIYSAVKQVPLPQDVAVTGEVSIRGKIKPVGGIPEKLYGAKRAGIRRVYIPKDNLRAHPPRLRPGVIGMADVHELLASLFQAH